MTPRTLLILSYHFAPSAASATHRLLGFVRHLPSYGWRCVVVAPPGLPWEATDEALLRRVPPATAIHQVPYPAGKLWKPLRWAAPWGCWLLRAWGESTRVIRRHRPDAILTSGPPHHIHMLGRHLRRWWGLPWVADFRDPWVAGDPSTFGKPQGWEHGAEAAAMRDAQAIIANTPGARDLLAKAYPQFAAKMVSITNGYDPENFESNLAPPLSGPTLEIVHPGQMYANRDPGPFVEAIRGVGVGERLGKALRVRFIGGFMFPAQKTALRNQISALGLEGAISIEGQVSYAESLRAMVQGDVLLLVDTPGRRAGVPAKLYEYIGAGRPILALAELDSDVAWVLRESGVAHRIAPPLDAGAIRRALTELLRDPATARCGGQPRPVQSRFTRGSLAGELAGLLDSCLEGLSSHVGKGLRSKTAPWIAASRSVKEKDDLGGYP